MHLQTAVVLIYVVAKSIIVHHLSFFSGSLSRTIFAVFHLIAIRSYYFSITLCQCESPFILTLMSWVLLIFSSPLNLWCNFGKMKKKRKLMHFRGDINSSEFQVFIILCFQKHRTPLCLPQKTKMKVQENILWKWMRTEFDLSSKFFFLTCKLELG